MFYTKSKPRPKVQGLSKEEFLKAFPAYVKLKRRFDREVKRLKDVIEE